MSNKLMQYIRGKGNHPIGVMVAEKLSDHTVVVGVSKCNTKMDRFDKDLGIRIAEGRISAHKNRSSVCGVPQSVEYDVDQFKYRARRYFRVSNIVLA